MQIAFITLKSFLYVYALFGFAAIIIAYSLVTPPKNELISKKIKDYATVFILGLPLTLTYLALSAHYKILEWKYGPPKEWQIWKRVKKMPRFL